MLQICNELMPCKAALPCQLSRVTHSLTTTVLTPEASQDKPMHPDLCHRDRVSDLQAAEVGLQ